MMEQTRIYKALKGVRGCQPVNLEALEQLMVCFSQLVVEQRWIRARFQYRGLGTQLLRRLLEVGRDEQLQSISAEILSENGAMQRVCEKLGFQIQRTADVSVVRAEIIL